MGTGAGPRHRGTQPGGGPTRRSSGRTAPSARPTAGRAGSLFRDHQQLLSELPADVTRADYLAAVVGQPSGAKPAERRMLELTIRALRDIRLGICEMGLEPPELPPQLKWLGEPEH